jgi:predicted RNA binding protein YcfA (HicA-like mRNA interferase family)
MYSGAEVIRKLERAGFVRMRQRGSHVVLGRGVERIVVPLHAELKKGTLHAILRHVGLDRDEFDRL